MTKKITAFDALQDVAQACKTFGHLDVDVANIETKQLWVVFSHVRIPEGKFAQKNVLKELPGHKLFLNCAENAWYTDGIAKFSNSLEDTYIKLTRVTQNFDVTYVGHSMGAYLSLLMGRSHAKSRFISTSPELFLGLAHSRSYNNKIFRDGKLRSITDKKPAAHLNKRGHTFFGAYDPIDCFFLGSEEVDYIGKVYEVPYHHGVTEYFTGNKIYKDILQTQDTTDPLWNFLVNRGHLFPKGNHGTKEQYRHFYRTFIAFQNTESAADRRALTSIYDHWENPGWQELRSKVWNQLKEPKRSFEAAEKAYRYDPNIMEFIDTYGTACVRYGETSRLNDIIDSMSHTQRQHILSKRLIDSAHAKFGTSFHEKLGKSLEGSAAPLSQEKKIRRVNLKQEDRKITARDLHKLNMDKEYDKVLSLTSPLTNPNYVHDCQVDPARALALIYSGNRSAGLRLIRTMILNGQKSPYFYRTLISCAKRTQNTYLVRQYLLLDVPKKYRRDFCRFLEPCLKFVTSPHLIADIICEVSRFGKSDLNTILSETSERLQSKKMETSIAHHLSCVADPAKLKKKNREIIEQYISSKGSKTLGNIWASSGNK